MHYPFLFYSRKVDQRPLFKDCGRSLYCRSLNQKQHYYGIRHEGSAGIPTPPSVEKWARNTAGVFGLSGEQGSTLLSDCPQMVAEQRFIHLGLDIIVPLRTPLHAPLFRQKLPKKGMKAAREITAVLSFSDTTARYFRTFYSFYGHLRRSSLPELGKISAQVNLLQKSAILTKTATGSIIPISRSLLKKV